MAQRYSRDYKQTTKYDNRGFLLSPHNVSKASPDSPIGWDLLTTFCIQIHVYLKI